MRADLADASPAPRRRRPPRPARDRRAPRRATCTPARSRPAPTPGSCPVATRSTRVVLLGPRTGCRCGRWPCPRVDAFATPLGAGPGRHRAARPPLPSSPGVVVDDRPHAEEHCLEVQLPFLQVVLGDGWTLLPIVVGQADGRRGGRRCSPRCGAGTRRSWSSAPTSATTTTTPPPSRLDAATAAAVVARRWTRPRTGPGLRGVPPPRPAGRGRAARPRRSSCSTCARPATRPATVGESSATARSLSDERHLGPRDSAVRPRPGAGCVDLARTTVRDALDDGCLHLPEPASIPDEAAAPGAAFVTLRRDGRLLGCIGSMEPVRPLAIDVADPRLRRGVPRPPAACGHPRRLAPHGRRGVGARPPRAPRRARPRRH